MSDKPLNAYSRCYACTEEQPDLIDHLGDPYVCGVIEDLRQQIAGLEAKHNRLRSAAQVVINFASHGSDVPTVYLGRLHEAIQEGHNE